MSDLNAAISETVNDQHPISDFINVAMPKDPVAVNTETDITGKTEKRGRGRPKGTTKAKKKPAAQVSTVWTGEGEPPPGPVLEDADAQAAADAVQRAKAAFGATLMVQTSGMMIAGGDGKMAKDEFTSVQQTFDDYFLAHDIKDFPPGVALALALGGYYIRVASTETARPRIVAFAGWAKNKFVGIFKRKKAAPPPEADKKSQ